MGFVRSSSRGGPPQLRRSLPMSLNAMTNKSVLQRVPPAEPQDAPLLLQDGGASYSFPAQPVLPIHIRLPSCGIHSRFPLLKRPLCQKRGSQVYFDPVLRRAQVTDVSSFVLRVCRWLIFGRRTGSSIVWCRAKMSSYCGGLRACLHGRGRFQAQ